MPVQAIPLWVYAAVMAASEGANLMAQRKVDNERAKAMAEERERRGKRTADSEATAEKSKQLFANAQANEDKRAGELAQQIAVPETAPAASPTGEGRLLDPASPPSATSTVAEAKDAFAGVDSRLAARAQALGKAGSFGSVFQDYGEALGRNAQDIDMNSTAMRNWNQRVLPIQLEAANNSGRQWGTAADVLKLAAAVMAPMALGGGAANAAGGATQEIQAARFGDLAGKSFGAFGGGSIPFGSSYGVEAALNGAGIAAGGAGAAGLVGSEGYSRALWKQLQGIALSQAERDLLLRNQLQ